MAETIKVDLEEIAPHRVALDLAYKIAHIEGKYTTGDRKYWLDLYQRCRNVVVGGTTAAFALQRED